MRMLQSALLIAMFHISGDNLAVVPNMTTMLGNSMLLITLLAYFLLGIFLTGILAWIGAFTGNDFNQVADHIFGRLGRKWLAGITLLICLPASALTGGYFTGQMVEAAWGSSSYIAIPICLIIYSLPALGYAKKWLKISNYASILFLPILIMLILCHVNELPAFTYSCDNINWMLVLALTGYSVGGMKSLLLMETSAFLSANGYKPILVSLVAKLLEGFVTIAIAYIMISMKPTSHFALFTLLSETFSLPLFSYLIAFLLFCVFFNTMAPAMMVNSQYLSNLTTLPVKCSWLLAMLLVWLLSGIDYVKLLYIISWGTLLLILFLFWSVCYLHKQSPNQ